jgi:hypothetical protein
MVDVRDLRRRTNAHLCGLSGGPVRSVPLEKAAEGPQVIPGVCRREGFCEVINVDSRESESQRSTAEQFATRFRFQLNPEDDSHAAAEIARTSRGNPDQLRQDEIWHWLLLALFGCLMAEGFLGNRTTT